MVEYNQNLAAPKNFYRFMKLFNIVTLGRFLEENSLAVALKAFAEFYHSVSRKYQKKTKLTLIDKRYHQSLNEKVIAEMGIQDCVSLLTLQQQKEIQAAYRTGSLLLLARKINSSSIIKESFLYGLPILCYEHASHSNLVDSSNSMTFYYENDYQAIQNFARNLNLLNFDPDAVSFLKKGAASKYEKDLSWGKRIGAG